MYHSPLRPAVLVAFTAAFSLSMAPALANSIKFNRSVFDRLQDPIQAFEKRYGAPTEDYGRSRVYEIGDCSFEVLLSEFGNKGGNAVVLAIKMGIVPNKCDITPTYIDPPRKVSKMKLKDFYGLGFREKFASECIVGCGNNYDPALAFLSLLPKAAGAYTLRVETLLPDGVTTTLHKANRQPGSPTIDLNYDQYTERFKEMAADEAILSYQEGYDFMTAFQLN
jgi:hypothetical protein